MKLRQVEVNAKKYINKEHVEITGYGYFHGWAQFRDGDEADMYALVEMKDDNGMGEIFYLSTTEIKFIKYYEDDVYKTV